QDYIDIQAGGNLIIEDGASLIQVYDATTATPPSASNTGNIELRRNTNIRQTDYVYWSSPVENYDVSDIYGAFTPTNYIFEWIPTVPTGTFVPGAPPTGGQPICFGTWDPLPSGNMSTGKGYIVRGPTNHTAGVSMTTSTFIGVANNGVITQPISSGNNPNTNDPYWYNPYGVDNLEVTHFDDNWNLLGNPYPSALDATSFLSHPNNTMIDGAVHIWTHGTQIRANGDSFYDDYLLTYEENDYVTFNLSGTNSYPDESFGGKIASGQGFFVLALNDNESGSVTFENDMRDRTHSNIAFYRNAESSSNANDVERHRIWLNLISDNETVSSTLVGYVQNATQDKDRLYDAYTREINNLSFYSKIGDERMIIQGRQLPFDVNDQVPLGTVLPEPGQYTIAISAVDGLFLDTNQDIYLEDTYNNIIHDLRAAPYLFSVDESEDFEDRFILRYTDETLGIEELDLSALTILAPKGEYIKIISDRTPIASVTLYDLLGRVLIHQTTLDTSQYVIRNHSFADGPYLVQVTLSNGLQKTQKVVLKQ
ncbi:MAG: T9SS type A sorting domain-containing protein, partial [Psychroserpens sp.]|nr:T9SS type A sorting domain-containing protein [Psychroserpens sp.]